MVRRKANLLPRISSVSYNKSQISMLKKIIILISTLFIIISISVYYFLMISINNNSTVNWKTYINRTIGYSIKYPENYYILDGHDQNGDSDVIITKVPHSDISSGKYPENDSRNSELSIQAIPVTNNNATLEKIKALSKLYGSKFSNITIGGEPAILDGNTVDAVDHGREYILSILTKNPQDIKIFETMLSTFTFPK